MLLRQPTNPGLTWLSDPWRGSAHRGIDWGYYNAHGNRVPILAAAPGRVVEVTQHHPDNGNGANQGWGNRVVIEHAPGVRTAYNHLRQNSVSVKVGDWVETGQRIAVMGHSGLSGGYHLHFELYINGVRVDPMPYFSRHLPGTDPAPSGGLGRDQAYFKARTNRRAEPSSKSRLVTRNGSATLPAGTKGNFVARAKGEHVSGSDDWYQGISGDWFHASGLDNPSRLDHLPLRSGSAPAAPAPKRQYVRLTSPWYYYGRLSDARAARGHSSARMLAAGDYLIVEGSGPYKVRSPRGDVWVGSRTLPAVITK